MKKLKGLCIMIVCLSVVGGVLAFKKKRIGLYCTRSTVNGVCPTNARCPNIFSGDVDVSGDRVCYTTTGGACSNSTLCNRTTRLLSE